MIKLTLLSMMAMQYLGTPYAWGGQNYLGMDCSGLVLRAMHDIGITLPDMTSQSIYNWALKQDDFYSCEPEADCLLFFGSNENKISHVAIALGKPEGSDKVYMIEAGGAGRNSLTMDACTLARLDARVRIKPVDNRRDLLAAIKLVYN